MDHPAQSADRYEGCLQGVGNGHALGWCWEPAAPNDSVRVAIMVDGAVVAEGLADIARPDLAEYGNGAHGFMIALPDSLQAPGRHRMLALAGPDKTAIMTAPSFWHEAKSSDGWSDVVFEPGEPTPQGWLPAKVPEPPALPDRRAVIVAGWLFDAREFEPYPEPTPAELDAIVVNLATATEKCAAIGVTYLPVLVPDKRRVVGVAPPAGRGWIAALGARLRDIDEVELIQLQPVLRQADRHGPPYHRTDTDWNDLGAFFVARALLKEAHKRVPALRPPALADLHLRAVPRYRGTLADAPKLELLDGELVSCKADVESEDGVVIDPSKLHALRMPVGKHLVEAGSNHLRIYTNSAREEEARLAIVGDSASLPVVTWLAECTRRTTFLWTQALPLTQLELELPPVVFHLIREADLHNVPLSQLLPGQTAGVPDRHSPPYVGDGRSNGAYRNGAAVAPRHVTAGAGAHAPIPAHEPLEVPALLIAPREDVPLTDSAHPPEQRTNNASSGAPSANLTAPSPTAPPPATPPPTLPPPNERHAHELSREPTLSRRLLMLLAGTTDPATRKAWLQAPDPRWPLAILGAGLFGFGSLLMVLSRHLSFFQDEYFWILHRRGWNIDAFWVAHNGHLSVVPVTIYKLLFVTVGLQHTWPYRLILVGLHLLCVVLIYALAARRAGRWIALIPAFLLLLLGAGYEDLLWAFQIGFVGSLAAGLGALLCLEQNSRRSDIAAAALVSVSLGSASVGLAVTVAIFAYLVAIRSPWRRLWIALGPLAIYVLWYLHFGTNETSLSNVPLIPSVDLETGAYGFASFGGLTVGYGQILLAAAVAYLVVRFWRGRTLPALTIVGILGALAFWTLTVITRAQYHEPGASRYIYPSAVFILIGAVGMLEWRRFPLRIWALFGLIIAAAGLSNLGPLTTYAKERTQVDAEVRDALGAAQVVGTAGDSSFLPDAHHLPWLRLGEYLAAVKDLGSPAFTPTQIAAQPEDDRELADSVIINAESFPLEQPSARALLTAVPAQVRHSRGLLVGLTTVAVNTSCTRLTPDSSEGFAAVVVPPGHALYLSMRGEGHVTIYARRLAHHVQSRPLHILPTAGTPALLQFPRDASTLPWHVRLVPTTRTAVCLV